MVSAPADRSLLDVARGLAHRERARRLAALDTIAEYFVLRYHLSEPADPVYVAALRRAFAGAAGLGAGEAHWQAARSWVLGHISFAEVPADLDARRAP